MKNSKLYGWYFHFNSYTGYWEAFRSENQGLYMNGGLTEKELIKSKNIKDLIRYVSTKTKHAITYKYVDVRKLKKNNKD